MRFDKNSLIPLFGLQCAAILARAQNTLYFPPADNSDNQIFSWTVHSGDTINITYNVSYENVKISCLTYAPGTNLTDSNWYGSHQPAIGNWAWWLATDQFLVNDTSAEIQSYFRIESSDDSTQFIRSQNFSVLQPSVQSIDSNGKLATPTDAVTWTGSKTLFQSDLTATRFSDRATTTEPTNSLTETSNAFSATSLGLHMSAGTLEAASSTSASVDPSSTSMANSTSSQSTSGPSSSGLNPGVYVAIALGAFILIALVLNLFLLVSKRRQAMSKPVAQHLDNSRPGLLVSQGK